MPAETPQQVADRLLLQDRVRRLNAPAGEAAHDGFCRGRCCKPGLPLPPVPRRYAGTFVASVVLFDALLWAAILWAITR